MHELGIVFHVIKSVEEVGRQNCLTRVSAVTLEIGEVSGVVPSYLTDCWDWAVKKSDLLRGAELRTDMLPAVTHCDGCGKDYPTVAHGKTCPHCGSGETWLLTGSELNIKEIEVPDPEPEKGEFPQQTG